MQNQIINLFASEQKLTFTQIKNKLNARSNLLSYWLSKLLKDKIIAKEDNNYLLSDSSEHLVPYLSQTRSTLPVILVHIGNQRESFLIKRTKRPYKDLLSLPGGRMLIGESPTQAAKRIMKTKFNLDISSPRIKSIWLEHVKKNKRVLFSFLLILIEAKQDKAILTSIKQNKRKIIPSDYKLIISDQNNYLRIPIIKSKFV